MKSVTSTELVQASIPAYVLWWVLYCVLCMITMGFTPLDVAEVIAALRNEGSLPQVCFFGIVLFIFLWGVFLAAQIIIWHIAAAMRFRSRRAGEAFFVVSFGLGGCVLMGLFTGAIAPWLIGLWMLLSLQSLFTVLCLHGMARWRDKRSDAEKAALCD